MPGPLKRRNPLGIELPKAPKQELIKPASDKAKVIRRGERVAGSTYGPGRGTSPARISNAAELIRGEAEWVNERGGKGKYLNNPTPAEDVDKRFRGKLSLGQKIGKIGKGMGKLGVAGSAFQALDWARWQAKEAKRKKAGLEPEV